MALWAVNRSPKHFTLPYELHPERWLKEDSRFANDDRDASAPFFTRTTDMSWREVRHTVIPISTFSLAKTCSLAYMETRLTTAKLLHNFDVELMPASVGWMDGQKAYFLWEKLALEVKLTPVERRTR